jgi:hypothetical protein
MPLTPTTPYATDVHEHKGEREEGERMYQHRAFRSLVEQRLLGLYLPTGTGLSSHDNGTPSPFGFLRKLKCNT